MSRNFTVHSDNQRSPEWAALRLGRVTGSCAADMLATVKSGEAAGRRNLRMRLVLERITNRNQERAFMSQAMQDGVDREAEAYAYYEALTGRMLSRTGFLSHNELMTGTSLDGHVGDWEGTIEIKCPLAATHWEYVKSGAVPDGYLKQIQHGLWLTEAEWCDFMSYHPEFPDRLKAKIVRVHRADVDLKAHETALLKFLAEIDTELQAVRTLTDLPAVLKEASVA